MGNHIRYSMNTTQNQIEKLEIISFSYGDILNQMIHNGKIVADCRELLLTDRRISHNGRKGKMLQEAIERYGNEYALWDKLFFTGKKSWDKYCENNDY